MKSTDKMDASMKAYAKRWMKSLDKPRPSTTLGYFFVGLFILFWSSSVIGLLGFDLKNLIGALVFIGIGFGLTLVTLLFVRVMALVGIDRPTRSACLFSAVIGPYVNMLTYHAWNLPSVSHILGFMAAILAFLSSIVLDRLLARPSHKERED